MTYPVSFLQARWYTPTDGRRIRLLVMHVMVAPEKPDTAEAVARLFHTWDRKASAHECIDSNSVVVCVRDKDVAFAAAGGNRDGKHYELAGYTDQSAAAWLDPYGVAMLNIAAERVAADAVRYGIPVVRLTPAQVRDGVTKGICDHATVEAAFPSTGHTDVGLTFPWDFFMDLVAKHYARLTGAGGNEEDDMDRTCLPTWASKQSNGRWPFYKVDAAPDLGANAVRVVAFPGVPLKGGITIAGKAMKYGSAFGASFVELVGLTAPVVGIEEANTDAGTGQVLVLLADGGTIDVGAKP